MTRHYYATLTDPSYPHVHVFVFNSTWERNAFVNEHIRASYTTRKNAEWMKAPGYWYHVQPDGSILHADGTSVCQYDLEKFRKLLAD